MPTEYLWFIQPAQLPLQPKNSRVCHTWFNTVTYGKHSLRYMGPKLWNKLTREARSLPSLKHCKTHFRRQDINVLLDCKGCTLCGGETDGEWVIDYLWVGSVCQRVWSYVFFFDAPMSTQYLHVLCNVVYSYCYCFLCSFRVVSFCFALRCRVCSAVFCTLLLRNAEFSQWSSVLPWPILCCLNSCRVMWCCVTF